MRSAIAQSRIRRPLLAAAATTAALTFAGPVAGAGAEVAPVGLPGGVLPIAPGECVGSNAPSGLGDAGATSNQICGAALAFVGPSVGQVASNIGPTIIGSVVLAPVTVSAGPVGVVTTP